MNHRYTELLRHQIRAAFIDGLRHFTCLDEKSIDGTYRECIDEVRAAIEQLDCTIYGGNGETVESLSIDTIKYILSVIAESFQDNSARLQRIQYLLQKIEIVMDSMKFGDGMQDPTFH